MKNNRTRLVILAATVLALSVGVGLAGKDRPMRGFMQDKLDHASGVLEGITLENYHMAITNAQALRNMDFTNSFVQVGNVIYRQSLTNFQARVDEVISAARARDLEKATEAYTKMARSCVECHKDFRREQFTRRLREQSR